jgi:carbonic anhydrase/acetyltransferase-like protein (isoleucine patch superfamily)
MSIRPYQGLMPQISQSAYIDEAATVIGDVHLGDESSVWPGAVIRGDVNKIRIGARSNIQDGTVIHVTHDYDQSGGGFAVSIGNDVTIGHNVTVHGCTIEDACLIGIGSIILDGATIGKQVLLGAGSLVPEGKILESGYLYLGAPAKKIRMLTDTEMKWFKGSASHYVKLSRDYL